MVARAEKVKARVEKILRDYPPARGDDTLMIYKYLCRYHPEVKFKFEQFEALLFIPAFETMRRRRAELHAEQKERVKSAIFAKHPEYTSEDLERALLDAIARKEISQYGEINILPTERVVRKRKRNEVATRHHYGTGLMTLQDFEDG